MRWWWSDSFSLTKHRTMSHEHGGQMAGLPSSPADTTSTLLSNLTSVLNATNTTSAASCTPEHFTVPLFDSADPAQPNSFSTKNQQAHVFLGCCLCALVVVWSLFAMDCLALRRAYRLSAAIQLLMGGYLLVWLFVLMYPTDVVALFAYSTSDLLQLQHLSISLLLLTAGWVELCQSQGWLTHPQWNVLWSICMLYVGLVFFAHEQHSYWATVQHISLGLAMVCGALLFGRVKEGLGDELNAKAAQSSGKRTMKRPGRGGNVTVTTYRNIRPDDSDSDSDSDSPAASTTPASRMVDNNLVLAGICYACAAAILILFRDHSHGAHTGTRTFCQPAWPLTAGGYAVAAVTATGVGLTLALFSRRYTWLSAACCPVDERRNIWLQGLNCILCIGQRGKRKRVDAREEVEEGGRQPAEEITMSAAAQMLAIVRDKEEEERRESERAMRRLKEMEKLFERKSEADGRQRAERWHQEDERKEESTASTTRQPLVHEVSSVEDA